MKNETAKISSAGLHAQNMSIRLSLLNTSFYITICLCVKMTTNEDERQW